MHVLGVLLLIAACLTTRPSTYLVGRLDSHLTSHNVTPHLMHNDFVAVHLIIPLRSPFIPTPTALFTVHASTLSPHLLTPHLLVYVYTLDVVLANARVSIIISDSIGALFAQGA